MKYEILRAAAALLPLLPHHTTVRLIRGIGGPSPLLLWAKPGGLFMQEPFGIVKKVEKIRTLTRSCVAILLLLVIGLIPLSARDIEITVEDADLALPLEGARIRSWDGQEYTCDEEGKVRIPVPDDRQVVLQVTYPGYENSRLLIPPGENRFTLLLHLSGILENQELVIEASRPGVSETRSGRSVAISDQDLSRTAEIGIIEDVMTSIKLLPGVGYAGMFNAMPSIRGGTPGDLTAVLDGFYIEQPYHWGGGVSIFDPRMVQSAQLSHGVFSSRYGHTISGLLEVTSKQPSATETELELGLSSSAANLNLSVPLWGKGGVMVMGKLTYWDPFVWAVKPFVEEVRYITTAPYIRSGALSAHYRFTPDMEGTLNGFVGGDGMEAYYQNESEAAGLISKNDMRFSWDNKLGFLIMGLTLNPLPSMVLKATAGGGFHSADLDARMQNDVQVPYSPGFQDRFGPFLQPSYDLTNTMGDRMKELTINYQGRLDVDWEAPQGFLFAAGVQELYSQWIEEEQAQLWQETLDTEKSLIEGTPWYTHYPVTFSNDVRNSGFFSSLYTLMEYTGPEGRFGAELGLRLDHLYFVGKDFSIQTLPALNPRLNLDFGILKNKGPLDGLSLTVGTGLFSSMNTNLIYIGKDSGIDDFAMKQSRSWTSIVGTKMDFSYGYSLTIETYIKGVFDRSYLSLVTQGDALVPDYRFDGEGRIWGFDLMLQKLEARYWDGWISYSFNHARYRNPSRSDPDEPDWYYPSFHRFHNLNIVLNLKPVQSFHIAIRFGLASGAPKSVAGAITSYPVSVLNADGTEESVIEKWKRSSRYSDTERDGFALPLDIKCSFFRFNPYGKVQSEIYVAVENTLAFLKTRQRNTTFNSYTGQEDEGSTAASYQLPIPMLSVGFKWTY
ncbi:MAG: TonB-dependent receptor plug domain-containing protein [Treponema sp.]|nr:TonB-dependent receptor plug domain-containing protein [Treponema sp.]